MSRRASPSRSPNPTHCAISREETCARAWEAEALADDRLPDRASFERHLATCRVCVKEARAIDRLRDLAKQADGAANPSVTPLEHRRQRAELLRRGNHELVGDTPPPSRRPRVVMFAVMTTMILTIACVVVLFFAWPRSRSPETATAAPSPVPSSPSSSSAPPPTFRMSTTDAWQRIESGETVHVHVTRGRFTLEVDKLKPTQRFLVDLPDGELEVQGTRFEIDSDTNHTRGVRVFEGKVALRITGQPPQTLIANESWTAEPEDAGAHAAASSPSSLSSPSTGVTAATVATNATNATSPRPAGSSSSPGADLGVAMEAYSAGDYGRAEKLFTDFEKHHPSDARVEDATFLIAVSRSKRGDLTGAREAARDYLRRYPNGFRRQEAMRLAQD